MASVSGIEDLRCHICRNLYTDPVSLQCGDRFCRVCIVRELDTQETCGEYSCAKCGAQFDKRPPMLHKRRRLCEDIPCTYCDDFVPAEKTCLHCDASLCAKHLRRHSTAPEHLLTEPTASPEGRKCPEHRQVLDHFCTEDNAFICFLCPLSGEHKNHEVAALNTNSIEMQQSNLKLLIRTLKRKRQTIDTQINFQKAKIDAASKRVIDQIQELKKELDALQDKVLTAHTTEFSGSIADWKKMMEEQKEEISKKIDNFQELLKIKDPSTFLKKILDTDLIGVFSVEPSIESGPVFDETPISVMLHQELLTFADSLNNQMLKEAFPKMKKSEITFDMKTAHCNILIKNYLRTAFYNANRKARGAGPGRFRSRHVLSKCRFSSGNHYWEVDVKGTQCSIGVAYDNLEKKTTTKDAHLGYNKRSWSLSVESKLSVRHNDAKTKISTDSPVRAFGIFLEYSAGRLSFYQLCDPIRHLHTFTVTFTRPLHAAFFLNEGSRVTIRN